LARPAATVTTQEQPSPIKQINDRLMHLQLQEQSMQMQLEKIPEMPKNIA